MPTSITREIAVCMLFEEPFKSKIANQLLQHIEGFDDLEICYDYRRPNEPMLLSKKRIDCEPNKYLIYPRGKNRKLSLIKARVVQKFL